MNVILVEKEYGMSRDDLMKVLKKAKIDTRLLFTGMNHQSYLKSGKYPNSDYLTKYGLYLPSGSGLKRSEIKYICNIIKEFKR